jgi:two-component system, cell cycle response regulator
MVVVHIFRMTIVSSCWGLRFMEKVAETWITSNKRPISQSSLSACLVHIYPVSAAIGVRYLLNDKPVLLGRGEECEIRIQDHSVSRRHARIQPQPEGFVVIDLNSTNGTFINDKQIPEGQVLSDGDYLRIGNCIYRYLAGGNVEAEYHEEIYRLTIIDALTQIHNHRYLIDFLEREVLRSARHNRPLSVMMFDIDKFKSINDNLGHLGGDFALRELAGLVRKTVRREDLFARYGGEEFCVVLVETNAQQAGEAGERIRSLVEAHPFRFEDKLFNLTISVGIAELIPNCPATPHDLLRRADENLFSAKRSGRNRVVG